MSIGARALSLSNRMSRGFVAITVLALVAGCGAGSSSTADQLVSKTPVDDALKASQAANAASEALAAQNGEICTTADSVVPTSVAVANVASIESASSASGSAIQEMGVRDTTPRWSDPATWGGVKPAKGASVLIPAGKRVLLDESTADLANLTIRGELIVQSGKVLDVSAGYIRIFGRMVAGAQSVPFEGKLTITLKATDLNESIAGMGTRAIFVDGGALELYGRAPETIAAPIVDHVTAGARSLPLSAAKGWKAGDQVVLAPTDYYGLATTEAFTVSTVSGNNINLSSAVLKPRWGRLQYVTSSGMSLAAEAGFQPRNPGAPTVLDERAVAGNLTRNIVIQGADDAAWANSDFGGHVMVMGSNAVAVISGVEMRRMGQGGRMGRYPIHFHLISYDVNGNVLTGSGRRLVQDTAVWNSKNRCMTIHGTNDVTLNRNLCYDIEGHAIFLEDAVERRNTITNNLVLKVRQPKTAILDSDKETFQRGPSGFWLTHPDNTVKGNRAADTAGNGFWMAFPAKPLGLNKLAKNADGSPILPSRTTFGVFEDNISHSNNKVGIQLDWVPVDDAGSTSPSTYIPTSDNAVDRYENRIPFSLSRITTYKNRESGFWNRVSIARYLNWVSADNVGVSFAGAGVDGQIRQSLVVGTSLNNANTWQNVDPAAPVVAFASYHSTFDMAENTLVNFPYVPGYSSGVFQTNDFYITPVDRGTVRNRQNEFIASHPGYRTPVQPAKNFTLAGALWDPNGLWGGAGNYWVFNDPFLTSGAACTPVSAPGGQPGSNGMSCATEYYGVVDYWTETSQQYVALMPLRATRLDAANNVLGTWAVGDGKLAPMFGNMRHFAAMRGGKFLLQFPAGASGSPEVIPALFLQFDITNFFRTTPVADDMVLGVPFSGSTNPRVKLYNPRGFIDLVAVGSYAEMLAGADRFWHDKSSNTLWFRPRNPNPASDASQPEHSDQNLYRRFTVRIDR